VLLRDHPDRGLPDRVEELRRQVAPGRGIERPEMPDVLSDHAWRLRRLPGSTKKNRRGPRESKAYLEAPGLPLRSRSMRSTNSVALNGLDIKSSAWDFSRQYSSLLPLSRVIAVSMRMGIFLSASSDLSDWQTSKPVFL